MLQDLGVIGLLNKVWEELVNPFLVVFILKDLDKFVHFVSIFQLFVPLDHEFAFDASLNPLFQSDHLAALELGQLE